MNIRLRVFSTIKETLAFSFFFLNILLREEPWGNWRLTIYLRWYSHFLSLDAKCEVSIKANKRGVTIWDYCLLSGAHTRTRLGYHRQAVAHTPSVSSRILAISPSCFSAGGRRRWIISKWLLARWLNGTLNSYSPRLYSGTFPCSFMHRVQQWQSSSYVVALTSEGHGCCWYWHTPVSAACTISHVMQEKSCFRDIFSMLTCTAKWSESYTFVRPFNHTTGESIYRPKDFTLCDNRHQQSQTVGTGLVSGWRIMLLTKDKLANS